MLFTWSKNLNCRKLCYIFKICYFQNKKMDHFSTLKSFLTIDEFLCWVGMFSKVVFLIKAFNFGHGCEVKFLTLDEIFKKILTDYNIFPVGCGTVEMQFFIRCDQGSYLIVTRMRFKRGKWIVKKCSNW